MVFSNNGLIKFLLYPYFDSVITAVKISIFRIDFRIHFTHLGDHLLGFFWFARPYPKVGSVVMNHFSVIYKVSFKNKYLALMS